MRCDTKNRSRGSCTSYYYCVLSWPCPFVQIAIFLVHMPFKTYKKPTHNTFLVKVILYSHLILKKMNERITDS